MAWSQKSHMVTFNTLYSLEASHQVQPKRVALGSTCSNLEYQRICEHILKPSSWLWQFADPP